MTDLDHIILWSMTAVLFTLSIPLSFTLGYQQAQIDYIDTPISFIPAAKRLYYCTKAYELPKPEESKLVEYLEGLPHP